MIYKLGSIGVTVAKINSWLGLSGDIYTQNTKRAVQEFQRLSGLAQDGVVGAQTWPKLSTLGEASGNALEAFHASGNSIERNESENKVSTDSEVGAKRILSESGRQFIFKHEGFRNRPYRDSAGIATIGYGNTYYETGKRVTMQDSAITRDYAERLFELIRGNYEKPVQQIVAPLTQNQFDALVSFVYNLGAGAFNGSTLRKKVISNPDDPSIRNEFMKWVNAGGKRVQGLVNRRAAEADLYFKK